MKPRYLYLVLAVYLMSMPASWAQREAVAPLVPRAVALQPYGLQATQATGWQLPTANVPTREAASQARNGPAPLVVVNSSVVIGDRLEKINPDDIACLKIYKGPDTPEALRGLAANGIIDLYFKAKRQPKFPSRTLAQIAGRLALTGKVSYAINGMSATAPGLRIANEAIERVDVIRGAEAEILVDIRIRHRITLPPAPPGTIRIRGTAAL